MNWKIILFLYTEKYLLGLIIQQEIEIEFLVLVQFNF